VLVGKVDAAVLPFRPAGGPPVARAPEVPAKKLSGLPFRPTEIDATATAPANPARLAALPFKPAADPDRGFGDDDRTRPVRLPNDRSLPFAPRPVATTIPDDPSTSPDTHPPAHASTEAGSSSAASKELPRMPQRVVKPQGGTRLGGGLGAPATQLGKSALGDAEGSAARARAGARAPDAPFDDETEFDDRPPFDPAAASSDDQPDTFRHVPEPPMLGRLPSEPQRAPVDVKKPDFLGALYERTEAAPAPAGSAPAARAATPAPPTAAPAAAPSQPDAAKIDAAAFPIEKCAAINAEIAMKRAPMAEVLKKHQVEADEWTAVDRHWLAAITKETERGKTTLLGTYDAAYVGALEKIRGPITTEDYARVVVGVERGDVAAVLSSLGVPRTALMRIERVWTKRLAEDAKLAQKIGAAVDAARKS
jgi:hypothetical protein